MTEKQITQSIKIFLTAISAYMTSGIVVQLIGANIPATVPVISQEKKEVKETSQVTKKEDYNVVWEKNIFGSGERAGKEEPIDKEMLKIEVVEDVEEKPDLPLSSLNYDLLGTVTGPKGSAFAVIGNKSGGKQKLYRVGHQLGTALITAIKRNVIILDNNGRKEMLEIKFDNKVMANRISKMPASSPGKGIKKVSANKFILDRKEVERLSSDVSQFMTQVRIVPSFVKGKADGYKMLNIKKGSLVEGVGFKNGDVIKEINGKSINKPEDAFRAYEELMKGGGFSIDIQRKGKRETIYYEVR